MASRDIAKEVQKIARRFQLKHKLTEKDAKRLLSKLKDKNDINKLIQQLKLNPQTADLAAELEAQAYAARIERLKATQTAVDTVTATIFSRAKKKFQFVLSKLAQGAYYKEIFGIQKRANAAFGIIPLDDKRIESVLKKPWSGDNYSKLLWKDTDRLAQTVKEQILIQILTGKRDHEIAQGIAESFGKGYNEARRLIRTESAYVTNQMALEAYKDMGVDKYIYLAILDLRTSKICQELDKKTFKVEDANVGENFPPMHPWCRSTTMAWMPPEILKKLKQRAWNPAKGESVTVPGDMTYKEWFDKYVKGNAKKPPQSRTKAQGSRNLTQEQYDRYKKRLGSDFPFTYDEFIKLKSDKAEWSKWKQRYKDGRIEKITDIDVDKYAPAAEGKIRASTLILTDRQKEHIATRRGEDFLTEYKDYFAEIAKDPDYIFKDNKHPNTAIASKTISSGDSHINLIIKLAVGTDAPGIENSIITAIKEGDKRYARRIKNNVPLYTKGK